MGNSISSFLSLFWSKKEYRILMIGLDSAGKTTILYKLKLVIGFNVESVTYRNIHFTIWDVGGQDKIRPLWKHYFAGTHAVIFVVDTADSDRMEEARNELKRVLGETSLSNAILLVFANKKDLPTAIPVTDVINILHLRELKNRNWFVQSLCATNGDGLLDGLDWLSSQLKNMKVTT